MFNAVNSSKMNNWKTIQEFSRTPENIQGQQDVFQESRPKRVLIANSRTFLGAQGCLATLVNNRDAGTGALLGHCPLPFERRGNWSTGSFT